MATFFSNGSGSSTYGVVGMNTTDSTVADIYPAFPLLQANHSGSGSICGHMLLKDPNLWFFFSGWATNYHPEFQTGACVGVGFFTFPVQVIKSQVGRRSRQSANVGKDQIKGPLGPVCRAGVIIDEQLSGSRGSREGGGAVMGTLTPGSHPGIIAQENGRSILGLTCRLEKSIKATTQVENYKKRLRV